jgi:hypothetical protein
VFWKAKIVHEKCVEMQLGLAGISVFFCRGVWRVPVLLCIACMCLMILVVRGEIALLEVYWVVHCKWS